MEYTNRRGDRYFVFQGRTKTGKPKYFVSKKERSEKGTRIESVPDGFEIFENPGNSTVSIRRRKHSRVIEAERKLVEQLAVERSAYSCVQTIIDGDCIVVYTPETDPEVAAAQLAALFDTPLARSVQWTAMNARYAAELRFRLIDEDTRHFSAERYCYRGAIDGWISISGPAPLESLARKFVVHLGRESFFDLM